MAAAAGQSTAVATIATVTAAVQSTWGSDKTRLTKDKLHNPTEWYVADDPKSRTRYFIIQGSDSLDHWKVNLTFDPVVFEDPSLGVKVRYLNSCTVVCTTGSLCVLAQIPSSLCRTPGCCLTCRILSMV